MKNYFKLYIWILLTIYLFLFLFSFLLNIEMKKNYYSNLTFLYTFKQNNQIHLENIVFLYAFKQKNGNNQIHSRK